MAKFLLPGFLLCFVILLLFGFAADGIFPAYSQQWDIYTFHGSYTLAIILLDAAFLFSGLLYLILSASVQQAGAGALPAGLALRRVLVGSVFGIILAATLFTSIYIFTKRVVVGPISISYLSLIEKKEVPWSQVTRANGNFVSGSRMGLFSRGDYAWVELNTRDGKIITFSMRFMQGVSKFGQVIQEKSK